MWQAIVGEGAKLKREQLEREIGKLPQPHCANLYHTFSKLFMFLEEDLEVALREAGRSYPKKKGQGNG